MLRPSLAEESINFLSFDDIGHKNASFCSRWRVTGDEVDARDVTVRSRITKE